MTQRCVGDVSPSVSRGVFVCERKRLVGCWAGSEETEREREREGGRKQKNLRICCCCCCTDQRRSPTDRQADRHGRTAGEDGPAERPSVALCFQGRSSRMSVALQDLRNTVSTHARARARSTTGTLSPGPGPGPGPGVCSGPVGC